MVFYVVTADDHEWFGRCRRAWDLGAGARQRLEPVVPPPASPRDAIRAALAVHYFPGMWTWDRGIVAPLVRAALDRAGGTPELAGMLDAYREWAAGRDHFTPLRVESDVEVQVLDPVDRGQGLVTPDGAAVRFRDRIEAALIDDDGRRWLARFLLVDDFVDLDRLRLDERGLLSCWAWEQSELHTLAGVRYTEMRLSPPSFRRTDLPRSHRQKWGAAWRLSRAAREMIAADLVVEPTPDWSHCRLCPFRAPCIAMNAGDDAAERLATDYRQRPPDVLEEGRLGGRSWSMNRGAAPLRLGRNLGKRIP